MNLLYIAYQVNLIGPHTNPENLEQTIRHIMVRILRSTQPLPTILANVPVILLVLVIIPVPVKEENVDIRVPVFHGNGTFG